MIRKKAIIELPDNWQRGECNNCPFFVFDEYHYTDYCILFDGGNCDLNVDGEHVEYLQQEEK